MISHEGVKRVSLDEYLVGFSIFVEISGMLKENLKKDFIFPPVDWRNPTILV